MPTMTVSHPQDALVPNFKTCQELLERIAESPELRRSTRLRELLFYVGRRSLKEGCERIHESEIGIEVFGRPEGYDTNVDNIVRTNVTELRKRIEAYFKAGGRDEVLVVEIPRGSYIPVFRQRPASLESQGPGAVPVPTPESMQLEALPHGQESSLRHQKMVAGLIVSGLVILALVAISLTFWNQNLTLRREIAPWRYSPSLAAFWSGFLNGQRDTDIVLEDSGFLLVQNLDEQTFSANDYLQHTFLGQIERQHLDQRTLHSLNLIWGKKLDRASDVELALNILSLDRLSKNLHLYNARDYSTAPLTRDNMVLLGNPTANPWDQLFEERLNFRETPENRQNSLVTNQSPVAGEQNSYISTESVSYCAIAYLPKSDHSGNLLLIQGTSSEATKAGGDFLLSEDRLSDFRSRLHSNSFPYFELLLKVSHVNAMPITSSIEAYRVYPNLK